MTKRILAGIAVLASIPISDARAQPGDGDLKPVAVEVAHPSRSAIVRELRMPATLLADEQVDLYAKTSGYVSSIDVDIGSRVTKGDTLVTLSVPEMADELRQAQAVLQARQAKVRALQAKAVQAGRLIETARADVERYSAKHELDQISLDRQEELRKGNAISQQALDEARSAHKITEAQQRIAEAGVAGAEAEQQAVAADVEVAQAEVMVARTDLARLETLMGYASIKAPFDGVITVRHVDHGTFARSATQGAATPLLRVAKTDRIRIVLEIPESDVRYIRIGTKVDVDVKALDAAPFQASVVRTAGALKPETRTMRVEIDIDNAEGRFAPGMYAQVVVKLESNEHALVIPSRAIRTHQGDTVVFVAEDDVVKVRPIVIGYDDSIRAEVLSGLVSEDLVIVSTGGAVGPGAVVSPISTDS